MNDQPDAALGRLGLIMMGGGARAAYQVGVLAAIADILPRHSKNPFPIICGTSAGAINAAGLAAGAADFHRTVHRLVRVWKNFSAHQVYRSDFVGVAANSSRWLLAALIGGLGGGRPVSMLDNQPLGELLSREMNFDAIQSCIDHGHLYAVSITASGYTSGESVSFCQGAPTVEGWRRARRVGLLTHIEVAHLLASAAIPFIFPAVRINREYFGDGSMRQIAPISPALHLGADRVLVIGMARPPEVPAERVKSTGYPALAQIAGHALNSIFLDGLEVDVERLTRINHTISLIPAEVRARAGIQLRRVEVLVISPSESLERIAAQHVRALPPAIRLLFRGIGAMRRSGANLASYLLFEKVYCRALIKLGYRDAMTRRADIAQLLEIGSQAHTTGAQSR